MHRIEEERLETDSQYRYEFLADFVDFSPEDAARIQAFAPHLGPRINELVERTYTKLLAYDATARHFVAKQHGCTGDPPADINELDLNHPQIQFRKDHLSRWFMQLIGRSYDGKMVQYLDMVGKIHTPKAGNKQINVSLVQMNALMGLIAGLLMEAVAESPLDPATAMKTQHAFNKLMWIQNDFITRHYC